jgi:hypothetical protein
MVSVISDQQIQASRMVHLFKAKQSFFRVRRNRASMDSARVSAETIQTSMDGRHLVLTIALK